MRFDASTASQMYYSDLMKWELYMRRLSASNDSKFLAKQWEATSTCCVCLSLESSLLLGVLNCATRIHRQALAFANLAYVG